MRSPRLLILPVVLVLAACGSGSYCDFGCDVPDSKPTSDPFVAGAACSSSLDCAADGLCGNWGSCFKGCDSTSECGSNGVCIRFSDGAQQCHQACVPGEDSCRAGFECAATTTEGGYCRPQSQSKAPTGASCSSNSECATNVCASWPGGYCSKGCNADSECAAGSVCVADAIYGSNACLVKCSAPGTRSSCRPDYTCVGLAGQSFGVCAPIEASSSGAGGGGGSGGGTGAGGGGATGGSAPTGPCRTYATSYTETISPPGGATRTITHQVTFDRSTLKLTDTSAEVTVVETFASLADFIDEADPALFLKRGGPSSVRFTSSNITADLVHSRDAQGRLAGSVLTITSGSSSFEALRATYTAWDAYGRVMSGRRDVKNAPGTEKCTSQNLGWTYDNAGRMRIEYLSGGANTTATNSNNCTPSRESSYFDARLIRTRTVGEVLAKVTTTQFATHATATVCQ